MIRADIGIGIANLTRQEIERARGRMLNTLRRYGVKTRKLLEETTRTWNHDVNFEIDGPHLSRRASGFSGFHVYTNDAIWNILEDGTDVRYVGVSDDWESKTVPGFLGSLPGSGVITGPDYIVPGIERRDWNRVVAEEIEGDLVDDLYNDMGLL